MPSDKQVKDPDTALTSLAGIDAAIELLGGYRAAMGKPGAGSSPSLSARPEVGSGPVNWFAEVLRNYRSMLEPLAASLPAIVSRLTRNSGVGHGDRLLFEAPLPEAVSRELKEIQKVCDLVSTEATLLAIVKAAEKADLFDKEKTEQANKKELARLLNEAHRVLDGNRLKDVPDLLDRLKHILRKQGKSAIGLVHRELGYLKDAVETGKLYTLVNALSAALGETAVRKVLSKHWLQAYAEHIGRMPEKEKIEQDLAQPKEPTGLEGWLRNEFKACGIVLSAQLSILANGSGVLILDHANDHSYEFRRPIDPLPQDDEKQPAGQTKKEDAPKDKEKPVRVYGPREGINYEVKTGDKGEISRPILLPVRVLDAKQGLAIWSVDKRAVQEALNSKTPTKLLRAWETAEGRTLLTLFVVDYREGDLGKYIEIGLACVAAPRNDRLAVGMHVLGGMLVSTEFSRAAGQQIWGYAKEPSENMTIDCDRDRATFSLENRITVRFPRGGAYASLPIPLYSYTIKRGVLHRTVITRSGEGEYLRPGGTGFSLIVKPGVLAPKSESAAAKPDPARRLCDNLQWFGIVNAQGDLERAPMYTVWTDHMKAELTPPVVVTGDEEGSHEQPSQDFMFASAGNRAD